MAILSKNQESLPPYRTLPFFLSLAGGIGFVYAVYPYGVGITDDSVNYLSAALSFPPSLQKIDGTPFIEWPPLYPVILSLYKLFGIPITTFTFITHLLSLVLSFWLIGTLISRDIQSPTIKIWGAILCFFSTPLLIIHAFAWSEAFFTTLLLANIFQLRKYLDKPSKAVLLSILSGIFLLSLQRKSGIIIAFSIGLCLWIFPDTKKHIWRFATAALCFLAGLIPFIFYLINRFIHSGQLITQKNPPTIDNVISNLTDTARVVSTWIIPDEIPLFVRVVIGLGLLLSCAYIYFRVCHPRVSPYHYCLLIILGAYLCIVNILFAFIKLDDHFDDRIFAPVFPLFLLLLVSIADFLYRLPVDSKFARRSIFLLTLGAGLWSMYPVLRATYHLYQWRENGVGGYSATYWRNKPVLSWLRRHPTETPIQSNDIFPVFYHCVIEGKNTPASFMIQDSGNKPYLYVDFNSEGPSGNTTVLFKSNHDFIYYRETE